jgi:hypothetical protein
MSSGPRQQITTHADLTLAIAELLDSAYRNGLDVEGGWAVPTPSDDVPNFDVEIWQLGSPHTR